MEAVAGLLRGSDGIAVAEYRGGAACEEVLKRMSSSPGLLHIVTHGQFCADVDQEDGAVSGNPLLRSVLAMSGANRLRWAAEAGGGEAEDGILTAYEVSALNLVGTDLAVLSACETGVGDVRNGEGVFGLRRAFQHAGTRSLLMTLWKIPDDQTLELITSFYEEWLGGASKKQALRRAVLKQIAALRSRFGVAHPYFWGGFVLVGDPN
jgi:CHAT domain-containing protein